MDWKWKTALVGALLIGVGATGCVEEEASVVMIGSVVGDGTIEEVDGDDDGEEEVNQANDGEGEADGDGEETRITCEFSADMEEPRIRSNGFVNLADMDVGQRLLRGEEEGATPNRYEFRAVFENKLHDSRSVGAVSGGEGGGFEGMSLDKNDILIKSATVSFDHGGNTFATDGGQASFGFEEERLVNMLVTSGGGIATLGIPVINNASDVDEFQGFLTELGADGDQSVPLVARIQLHGETLAGNEIESNRIDYPIDFCLDCGVEIDSLCREG